MLWFLMMKERMDSCKLYGDLHLHAMAYTYICTYILPNTINYSKKKIEIFFCIMLTSVPDRNERGKIYFGF